MEYWERRERKYTAIIPQYSTSQLHNAPVKLGLKSNLISHKKRKEGGKVFYPEFGLLSVRRSTHVHMPFLHILHFPPTSWKHECRWIGFDKLPLNTKVCAQCPEMDWSSRVFFCLIHCSHNRLWIYSSWRRTNSFYIAAFICLS